MIVRRNGARSLLAVLAFALAAAPVLAGDASLTGIVNVNTATVDQLVLLPGIGESRANAMIERAKKEIEAHVATGKTELRKELGRLSIELAGKIIEREIREEDHAELVTQFVAEIESKAKEGSN